MKKLVEQLNSLKDAGLSALKCDFEAEGAEKEELEFCRELTKKAKLLCYLKIGGAEAVCDLKTAKACKVDAVVAPMIESSFAVKKFLGAVERVYGSERPKVMLNIESKTGENNLSEILSAAKGKIDGITIGRVDFSASYGFSHEEINDSAVSSKVKVLAEKIEIAGERVTVGGGLDFKMARAIYPLKDVCESFETRKLVFSFDCESESALYEILRRTLEFEIAYLEYRKKHMAFDDYDKQRLEKIKSELQKFGE